MIDICGKTLAGRYTIVEKIGEGGMAVVYRAIDNNTTKTVAVKVLREEYASNASFVERFRSEALAASRMSHPGIVNLLDVGEDEGVRYIVIEYINGASLRDLIRQQGALRPKVAADISTRLLAALSHAHEQGIIHRDIKPQNILVDRQHSLKILDFGIARVIGSAVEPHDQAIGSVHYFSPEQARGELADQMSDIYSVGVVLYEMLTGKKPFDDENDVSVALSHIEDEPIPPHQIDRNIPLALSNVVIKAMSKKPSDRFQSASDMVKAIKSAMRFPHIEESKPKSPQTDTTIERKRQYLLLWRKVATASLTALLLIAIILLIIVVGGSLLRGAMNRVIMPTVTNKAYIDATRELEALNLSVRRLNKTVEIGADGIVIDQDPPPGVLVPTGGEVTLTVSISEGDLVMPTLTQKTLANALDIISTQKLVEGLIVTVPSEAAEGLVVGQTPQAGAKVRTGQSVSLEVSGGLVFVPNFVGMAEKEAIDSIPAKLTLSDIVVEIVSDSKLDGVILSQTPEAYSRAVFGAELTLTLGRLDSHKFIAQVETKIALTEGATVKAALVLDDDTEEVQYSAKHPEGETTATFILKSGRQGSATCRIYADDVLLKEIDVVFE